MQVNIVLAHRNVVQEPCNPLRIHHLHASRAGHKDKQRSTEMRLVL